MYAMFFLMDMAGESLKTWMNEWVYGCPNRQAPQGCSLEFKCGG
jgi:hypothetical protein